MNKHKNKVFIFLLTFFTQLISGLSGILLIKIMTAVLDKSHMGVFILTRRFVQLIFPVVLLNLNTSIAKFVSSDQENTNQYYTIGLIGFFINYILFFLFLSIFKNSVLSLIFGSSEFSYMLLPIILYLLSMAIYNLNMNFYRGKREFRKVNLITLLYWFMSVLFAVCVLLLRLDDKNVLIFYFISFSITVILVTTVFCWRELKIFKLRYISYVKEENYRNFLKYGILRLPAPFFSSSLFFLPIYMATKYYGLSYAAILGLVFYVIQLFYVIGSTFGIILLPEFSHSYNKSIKNTSNYYKRIFEIFITAFLPLGVITPLFVNELVPIMFNQSYLEYGYLFRIGSAFIGFYLIWVTSNSILNGLFIKPYTVYINFGGLIFFISLFFLLKNFGLVGLLLSQCFTLVFIAVLSNIMLERKLRSGVLNSRNLTIFIYNLLMFVVFAFVIKNLGDCLFIKIIATVIYLLLSWVIYSHFDIKWIKSLNKYIQI